MGATYITFAHHCFDPSSTDVACRVSSAERGIPAGLDWVGFDWYNDSNDLTVAATHVPSNIVSGITRIGQLAPAAKVILVPEAYTDGNRLELTAVTVLHDYFALYAQQGPPFDHAYALSPNATLPPGYVHEFPIGWVYPPSAL